MKRSEKGTPPSGNYYVLASERKKLRGPHVKKRQSYGYKNKMF